MDFKIIDFHTHPFIERENNICTYADDFPMGVEETRSFFEKLGISTICGTVISGQRENESAWEAVKRNNNTALQLREIYGDFYVPGFHIHPDFVEESIEEIHRMHALGVRLIGELVPYFDGWENYARADFSRLLDEAEQYDMVVNFHSVCEEEDEMDEMVKAHKNLTMVAAHPGEYPQVMRHLNRMKFSDNYYLDLSGYGIFRHGMLRHAIDEFGVERFLFGSDFPTCNAAMYIGGIALDPLITDKEKDYIFEKNAKRLLHLD